MVLEEFLEQKLFGACLNAEKKAIMTDALTDYIDTLNKRQASHITTQRASWLLEEIKSMTICK